jgi:hypothetical protein
MGPFFLGIAFALLPSAVIVGWLAWLAGMFGEQREEVTLAPPTRSRRNIF